MTLDKVGLLGLMFHVAGRGSHHGKGLTTQLRRQLPKCPRPHRFARVEASEGRAGFSPSRSPGTTLPGSEGRDPTLTKTHLSFEEATHLGLCAPLCHSAHS